MKENFHFNSLLSYSYSTASLFGRFCLFIPASTTFLPFQPAIKLCARTLKSIQIMLLLGATCRSSHGASHTATLFFLVQGSAELRTDSHFSRTLEPPAARAPHCFISRIGGRLGRPHPERGRQPRRGTYIAGVSPVSYTHLTLPTILLV